MGLGCRVQGLVLRVRWGGEAGIILRSFFKLSSLELSDTTVYEPSMRALLGTAAHFCKVGVLKLRTGPRRIGQDIRRKTPLSLRMAYRRVKRIAYRRAKWVAYRRVKRIAYCRVYSLSTRG